MFTYLLFLFLVTSTASITVYVNDSSPFASDSTSCGAVTEPCETLDLGLDVIQSLLKDQEFQLSVELIIADGEYDHSDTTNGVLKNVNGITITGQSGFEDINQTIVNCIDDSGFSFINSSNIIISGIEFIGCEQLQYSTSNANDTSFSLFYVGLYFLYCRDVNLTGISVTDSHATGIVLYNIIGTNILDTVIVSNNTFTTEKEGSGGGVYIEYSYCVPYGKDSDVTNCLSKGITNVYKSYTNDSNFQIKNSLFSDNIANISDTIHNSFILPSKQSHAAFGRGGGLSIFFKGNASYNNIAVHNCTFRNNRALWGAGLFVEYQDSSFNNIFIISDSLLSHNSLYFNDTLNEGTGGGGARVGYISFDGAHSHSNEIVFENCTFHDNSAYYGGGLSFYSARQLVDNDNLLNVLKFSKCNFNNNSGRIGAGLDISLWHTSISGKHPHCLIEDTVFTNNTPVHPSNGGLVGIGAVYVDSLPTIFSGTVTFEGNSGSALVLTGSYVTISSGAIVNFTGNTGRNGGAIALLDNTFIVTSENSSLNFINNSALYKGGAIYSFRSGERDLISSRSCFLRYENISTVPEQWNVNFTFQNNTIQLKADLHKYNAIYATSLLPCLWGGSYGNATYQNISNVFCWSPWAYKDKNGNVMPCKFNGLISSSPMTYHSSDTIYSKKPGQPFSLNIDLNDQLSNNVTNESTLIARVIQGNARFRSQSLFTYISHEHFEVYGEQNTNIKIQLETLDPVVISRTINVMIETCPPGFTFYNDTMACICYGTSSFHGYIQCNENNFDSAILRTAWIGKRAGNLVAGETLYSNIKTTERFITLYNDSKEYLNDVLCGHDKRNGTLCGSCQIGYGVEVSSHYYSCVECQDHGINWVYYVLSTYFPITIFFIAVFLFSMTVTSGPLNGFVFFAQVMSVIEIDADGMIPLLNVTSQYLTLKDVYVFLYSIWNMNFHTGFIKQFCLSTSFNTMDIFLLRYGEALYPLILLCIIVGVIALYNKGFRVVVLLLRPFHYCLARFQQWSNLRPSITGGIAIFIVISYTKFTLLSLLLLTSGGLYNITGDQVDSVHYYSGDVEFPSMKYVIPAIIVLVTFGLIPPLLLIYPSLLRLVERLSYWRLNLTKLYPFPKLAMFMDEFYGCYKDGRDRKLDCRWFAGLYFILRIILFAVYGFTQEWYTQYLVQILLFNFVAFLFAFIRPYRKDWLNNLDCCMFLLLATISTFSLYNLIQTRIGSSLNAWAFSIQYILILVPLLYCIGYYFAFICKRSKGIFKRCIATKSNKTKIPEENVEDSHGYQNALVGSTHVPNIMEYIGANNRMRSLTNSTTWRSTDGTAPLIVPQNRNNYEAI